MRFELDARHPIRGVLWGLMMGIGLSVVLVVTKVIDLELGLIIGVTATSISSVTSCISTNWST